MNYSTNNESEAQNQEHLPKLSTTTKSFAKLLSRIGRIAILVSVVMGLFAAKIASAKLGFMLLLPGGLILIAISGYVLKQVKLQKYKLAGRDAEIFSLIIGGCALIGLVQVLVEQLILHK